MNNFSTWDEALIGSFQNLWERLVAFLPQFLAALVVFIAGLIIASLLAKLVSKLLALTKVDELLSRIQAMREMKSRGIDLRLTVILGEIVRWFFIIITLLTVADILGLAQVNAFLESVLLYLPNVVVAVIIFALGFIIAQFVADVVRKFAVASRLSLPITHVLALVSEWAILLFSIMAGLLQLGVAADLIQILFAGIVATFTLALGLAFGLGGKEVAAKFLNELERHRDTPVR